MVCNGVSFFLAYSYFHVAPKKQYRETAMQLQVVGFAALLVVVMSYIGLVITRLDRMGQRPGLKFIISTNEGGLGTSFGVFLIFMGIVFKVVACALFNLGKTKEEVAHALLKEQREDWEAANFPAALSGYTGGYYGAADYAPNAYQHQQPQPQVRPQQQYAYPQSQGYAQPATYPQKQGYNAWPQSSYPQSSYPQQPGYGGAQTWGQSRWGY
jgi:hypothetical protein